MTEIGVLTLLFLLSFAANTFITLWSTKKVLGIEVSLVQSGLIVLGRFFAGFAVGYAIRIAWKNDSQSHLLMGEGDDQNSCCRSGNLTALPITIIINGIYI